MKVIKGTMTRDKIGKKGVKYVDILNSIRIYIPKKRFKEDEPPWEIEVKITLLAPVTPPNIRRFVIGTQDKMRKRLKESEENSE